MRGETSLEGSHAFFGHSTAPDNGLEDFDAKEQLSTIVFFDIEMFLLDRRLIETDQGDESGCRIEGRFQRWFHPGPHSLVDDLSYQLALHVKVVESVGNDQQCFLCNHSTRLLFNIQILLSKY